MVVLNFLLSRYSLHTSYYYITLYTKTFIFKNYSIPIYYVLPEGLNVGRFSKNHVLVGRYKIRHYARKLNAQGKSLIFNVKPT